MLAARLPGLLPPLEPAEALEVSMIHSIGGHLAEGKLLRRRPFRDPHHSASVPSLVGGGSRAKPGEVSLAHNGVLFLDELPEFQRAALEALRQPLESGRVSVARANAHVVYPSRIQLVAAMNPCRCGYLGDAGLACTKAPKCGAEYQNKISGPLFDRIDLHVEVPAVSPADLSLPPPAEGSAQVAARVAAARALQAERGGTGHPQQCLARWRGVGKAGRPRRPRPCPVGRGDRPHASVGTRLSPGATGGPHPGRSARRRRCQPPARGRSPVIPPADAGAVIERQTFVQLRTDQKMRTVCGYGTEFLR